MNKFELVRDVIRRETGPGRRLLDVGCRGCELKPHVADFVSYEGVDLVQNPAGAVDHVLDVEKGIPLPDRSYDDVVALDLVEHLDGFQKGLEELLRLSRHRLLIMLPNVAHMLLRKDFLLRGRIGAKYDLVYGMGQDRHRWVTVLPQNDEYLRRFAEAHGLDLETIWFYDSPKKRMFARIARFFRLSPSWYVWASLYVMTRKAST